MNAYLAGAWTGRVATPEADRRNGSARIGASQNSAGVETSQALVRDRISEAHAVHRGQVDSLVHTIALYDASAYHMGSGGIESEQATTRWVVPPAG